MTSKVPVLLLAGDYDPVTPPEFARLAAKTLKNTRLFEFKGLTHGVMFSTICARQMMQQFLTAPDGEIDTKCMEQLKADFQIY